MIHLACRTEFSFRMAFGAINKILSITEGPIGICDRSGTWGHVSWSQACKKLNRKPIFGVELAVVEDMKSKTKQGINFMKFIARNNAGLQEIYQLTSLSTMPENHYYIPRIDYGTLFDISDDVYILSGSTPVWGDLPRRKNLFVELNPSSMLRAKQFAEQKEYKIVATDDNFFPLPQDRKVYEVLAGRDRQMKSTPMHLLSSSEWNLIWPGCSEALENAKMIAEDCNADLPSATMVKASVGMPSLESLCADASRARGIDLTNTIYRDRLNRELGLIHEKQFEEYFYLVWDLVRFAKKHMLVGPARGSSCGSLVCFLLGITEVDPIPYDLLFERFIDINRKDLPDIDIDFPDDRRDLVFEYLRNKYGSSNVARLGTVMRYKAKSSIDLISKELNIPAWEVVNFKNSIIERSTGDSRAGFCITDSFEQLEVGKQVLKKYPQLKVAADIEGHASGCGQHAAGIVVTAEAINNFCSVDNIKGSLHIDKHDAEDLNLLKIDALGLRTLSVLQDCLDQVGWSREQLISYPTNDKAAYAVLNNKKFAGIFQFEGHALQTLCSQMLIDDFEDIAALTALARPGPLHSGGTTEYIRRRIGEKQVVHLHPLIAHTTANSWGVVIYQEQVMQISREMGKLSWEDVSLLRKAMSKSLGKEYFDGFKSRFITGAIEQKVDPDDAGRVWDNICTMGSWSFNRCISADTRVKIANPGPFLASEMTIEEMYERYVVNPSPYLRQKGFGGPTLLSMGDDGRVRPQRATTIHKNGIKDLIELCFADGTKIKCTKDHKFIINGIWTTAGKAEPNDYFACSEYEPIDSATGAGRGHNLGKKYCKPHEGFLPGKENISWDNGRTPEVQAFKEKMKGKPCQVCNKKHKRPEAHHEDSQGGKKWPNRFKWLCPSCHKKIHYGMGRTKVWEKGHTIVQKKLVTVMSAGRGMTYDIEMPVYHNYVLANGVLTHNSHAVAYAMVSYWCMVLKAKFPLEFSAACLRNARDESQSIRLLRELSREDYKFKAYDYKLSQKNWSVQNGMLIGGLTNIKGVGDKMAEDIILRRSRGIELTTGQKNKLANGITPFDSIFECDERWGHLKKNPEAFAIRSKLLEIENIQCEENEVDVCFIAKIVEKDLRDLNDPTHIKKRNGNVIKGQSLMVLFTAEDDTDQIACQVDRHSYVKLGLPLIEQSSIGDWFIWKGRVKSGFRQVQITNWRKLSGIDANQLYQQPKNN